jgi:hypothetical protein
VSVHLATLFLASQHAYPYAALLSQPRERLGPADGIEVAPQQVDLEHVSRLTYGP